MIQKLDWNNYLEINTYINNQGFKFEPLSTISLVQYELYGYGLMFNKQKDYVIFYIKEVNNINSTWNVFTSFYKQDFDIESIKQTIKNDLINLNCNEILDSINFSYISKNMVDDWKLNKYHVFESIVTTNYLYELEKMKTFAGKKLQKKRNHLNYFESQDHNIIIKNIRDVTINEILDYIDQHIKKYADSYREYEIDVYKHYFDNGYKTDKNFSGIVIYINNQIVGLTLGYLNFNTYEIIIEKAERDIRGLYQYLIKQNLIFNNINCEYMEREDDAGVEMLAKSKLSYHPIIALKRYNINNVKDW